MFARGVWGLPLLLAVALSTTPAGAQPFRTDYPLSPASFCGATQTCSAVVDRWDSASWNDLVDDSFNTGPQALAAVRWYSTENGFNENPCPDALCAGLLNSCGGTSPPDPYTHHFCGVTDELGNVLLSHAMGSDKVRYEKLHRFTELLRISSANDLQCWKYRIDGAGQYTQGSPCIESDSASDASLRILGAYGIACAKQRAGIWTVDDVDFCADYLRQGRAIWGLSTTSHGEIRQLGNGQYFLANGYNNQAGAPTANESFRPDYYELQFLMDFAEYLHDPTLVQGVQDMLRHYLAAADVTATGNHIHRGKHGHFDALATTYTCDSTTQVGSCGVAGTTSQCKFMDQTDTWRAIPALSGLRNVHPEAVTAAVDAQLFQYWWQHFSGGHATLYGPTADKPIEIWASSADGGVKCVDGSYKTLGMWIPLAASMDPAYTLAAVRHLVDDKYLGAPREEFEATDYYGGYFSQFAQRAIGAATGMIDPAYWARTGPFRDFFTITPCRALDTRSGPPYASSTRQTVVIVGGPCPVPSGARAVSMNVTVVAPGGTGYLTLFAGDGILPTTSTLNFGPGQTRSNNALVALASNGLGTIAIVPVVAGGGTVHVVVDVTGYFQ